MSMTLEQIADRIEINDLLVRYSHAIDTRDWALLDQVFTPDAFIDYTAMGGAKGNLAETKEYLSKALGTFVSSQHMVSNSMIELDGDRATGRTMCHNPMAIERKGEAPLVFFCGLWYLDEFVRTGDGWRIRKRVEEKSYFHNAPPELLPPS